MGEQVTVSADDVRLLSQVFSLAARAFGAHLGAVPGFGAALEACGRLDMAVSSAQMPEDPISSPRQLAITYRHMLDEFEAAGWPHEEAFTMTHSYFQATATAAAMRALSG